MTAPFVQLSPLEKLRAAFPVLVAARRAVVFEAAEPIEAIQEAGAAGVACWFAREILQRFVPSISLQAWQSDRGITQSDRTRAFDRAVRFARRAFGHRGGWNVAGSISGPGSIAGLGEPA